jgi:hypothetical protein
MAEPKLTELLGTCNHGDEGCFASDQDALESMLWFDDSVIRSGYGRIANAADDAASHDLPLAEATFEEPMLDIVGFLAPSLFDYDGKQGVEAEIGQGETRTIGELLEAEPESVRARVANCAYTCGKVGVGGCPIKTP